MCSRVGHFRNLDKKKEDHVVFKKKGLKESEKERRVKRVPANPKGFRVGVRGQDRLLAFEGVQLGDQGVGDVSNEEPFGLQLSDVCF